MKRRTFLSGLTLEMLLAPLAPAAEAQQTGRTPRIGYLTPVTGHNPVEEAFERSLQELGWIKGRNWHRAPGRPVSENAPHPTAPPRPGPRPTPFVGATLRAKTGTARSYQPTVVPARCPSRKTLALQ